MSDPDTSTDRLKRLETQLEEARRRRAPKPRAARPGKFAGAELAWRMVIELSAGIAVGTGMGWGLDGLFGTKPVFLILFILLGFAAGVRVMLQSAAGEERRRKRREADAAQVGGAERNGNEPPGGGGNAGA
ncbi:AtpZ/AtpI family protein [Oceanicella actignis]|uniref:ATP synthase protein I n=1 Tax=Oceanicella actignis TaxID=1189325 RepID=A0A1M7TEU7_9RHOB|nr:AtpZ/AtpI family protein [Oceanicella actignis]TYO88567.1 ATP synthase protein I [Oceanicella actignis]SET61669.1 ATP synthase protein I [Oceanicella actignis]SHN69282.1 ATP synthase protein I [Oceanicella actignis]